VLLAWAPLPLASNRPLFWAGNALLASACLGLFLLGEVIRPHRPSLDWRPAALMAFGLAVWVAWMILQTVPHLPRTLWNPVWTLFPPPVSGVDGTISADPAATWDAIAQVTPIGFLAILAFRLGASRTRAETLLRVVVLVSVGIALYGFAARFLGLKQAFLISDDPYAGYLTGTFVGRNAAATYFILGLSSALGLLEARLQDEYVDRIGARRPSAFRAVGRATPYLLATAVLLAALLDTGSRGGFIAGGVALGIFALLQVWRRSNRVLAFIIFAGVGAVVAGTLIVASDTLLRRLEPGLSTPDRLPAYRDVLDMIAALPWRGQGAGTFAEVYPLYHLRAPFEWIWTRAHNSYLQMAAELGVPVTILLTVIALGLGRYLLRGAIRSVDPVPAATAATVAAAAVAVHSTVDFSAQIQAVGLTLAVLIGAGLGQVATRRAPPIVEGAGEGDATREIPSVRPLRRITVRLGDASAKAEPNEEPVDRPLFRAPDGTRVYVFADLHGRVDLFERVVAAIASDRRKADISVQVVGLGDYVDRGPASRDLLDKLIANPFGAKLLLLRGNHERMMLDFVESPAAAGPLWFANGAVATLRSYGLSVRTDTRELTGDEFVALRDQFCRKVPQSHVALLRRLMNYVEIGGYFFAHAGARPGRPLQAQTEADLLWIREGFADRDEPFEKMVIHGHTPVDQPYLGKYRVNLDVGGLVTNRVAVLVLEGSGRRLLTA
jgi:serine/threonine protein phosphatase 1